MPPSGAPGTPRSPDQRILRAGRTAKRNTARGYRNPQTIEKRKDKYYTARKWNRKMPQNPLPAPSDLGGSLGDITPSQDTSEATEDHETTETLRLHNAKEKNTKWNRGQITT